MRDLPTNVKAYKVMGPWTREKIPSGLLKAHNTKEGVWGRLDILEGELTYTIEETNEQFHLVKDDFIIIEPLKKHFIGNFSSNLEIKITFHR